MYIAHSISIIWLLDFGIVPTVYNVLLLLLLFFFLSLYSSQKYKQLKMYQCYLYLSTFNTTGDKAACNTHVIVTK